MTAKQIVLEGGVNLLAGIAGGLFASWYVHDTVVAWPTAAGVVFGVIGGWLAVRRTARRQAAVGDAQ